MATVIDTNVIVSGLLTKGTCRELISLLKNNKFILAISPILFEELKFVIGKEKFQLLMNEDDKEGIISFIKSHALFFEPKIKLKLCRDTKDNKILETAITAKADFIVTGDDDLLSIKGFSTPIITPKEFLKILQD